ncbi:MAG TPA: hypothetical protein VFB12_12990 [Ktedonobacteraceae bacterium]|nr:hypothetical protein [Ktedonobacteraceae bacterium]
MDVVTEQQGRELMEVGQEAGAEMVCESSLKAALDRNWNARAARGGAGRGFAYVAGRRNVGAGTPAG